MARIKSAAHRGGLSTRFGFRCPALESAAREAAAALGLKASTGYAKVTNVMMMLVISHAMCWRRVVYVKSLPAYDLVALEVDEARFARFLVENAPYFKEDVAVFAELLDADRYPGVFHLFNNDRVLVAHLKAAIVAALGADRLPAPTEENAAPIKLGRTDAGAEAKVRLCDQLKFLFSRSQEELQKDPDFESWVVAACRQYCCTEQTAATTGVAA